MFKKKILIAANSAVLFGCIALATVSISGCSDYLHNNGNTISTTQVSESFSIPAIVKPTTDSESTAASQEETTSVSVTDDSVTADVTTSPAVVDVNSEDNAVFSFTKVIIDKPDFDYYDKLVEDRGYVNIENIEELSELSEDVLKLKDGKKQIKYIITSKGLFDDIVAEMDILKANAQNVPSFYNFNKRDRFLCDELGLDYQKYYSNGIALFMIKKIQDIENNVNSNSVYAIYHYAYNTYEQLLLQNEEIENIADDFSGTDYEKVLAAHEFLRNKVDYVDNGSYLVQTAYGAIINREAVCEGYAKSYKLLLNAMGIECDVVINSEHAWNVVKLDGKWYLVDVTNDDTNDGMSYFLLGKDVLLGDNDTAEYFGYIDSTNTDVRVLAENSYQTETEE